MPLPLLVSHVQAVRKYEEFLETFTKPFFHGCIFRVIHMVKLVTKSELERPSAITIGTYNFSTISNGSIIIIIGINVPIQEQVLYLFFRTCKGYDKNYVPS